MDLKELLQALGLPADTSESDALAACAALKQSAAEAQEQVAALKATAGKPDPARFVPVEQLEGIKADLAALRGQMAGSEVDRLVSDGMQAGKILPVQEQWAKELGTANMAALKSYLDNTPAVAALNQSQTGGKPPADGEAKEGELSESQMAICKAMGLKPEDYKAQLAASR